MAFQRQGVDLWKRRFSRALLVGPPNSWKTTSLLTWPRPLHVLTYPGEKGSSTLPPALDNVHVDVWEEDPLTAASPGAVASLIEQHTIQVLASGVTTFAGDGLHKFYEVCFAASEMELGSEEKVRGRVFGEAHRRFLAYLKLVLQSPVPYIVMTCWDAPEKDNPLNSDKDAPKHFWPDFAGQLAKRIVGEFGAVLYANPGRVVGEGKLSEGTWWTRPHASVWGAGLKVPVEIAKQIPTVVVQDWVALEKAVLGLAPAKAPAGVVAKPLVTTPTPPKPVVPVPVKAPQPGGPK